MQPSDHSTGLVPAADPGGAALAGSILSDAFPYPAGGEIVDRPAGAHAATPVWLRLPTFQARATNLMLGVLVLIFLYEIAYGGGNVNATESDRVLRNLGAKVNDLIVAGQYWRLVTAMFLHAGILHIASNGWALWFFGQQIERFYGWKRFLAIYFVGGLAGSIASFAFSPSESVGASGAIMGLIGATGAYFWLHRRLLGAIGRSQLWNAVAIVGLNLVLGLTQSGAIDNLAHIGGFLGGLIAGLALAPRYRAGRALAPDERLLEDRTPAWVPPSLVGAMLGVELILFALALAVQKGLAL